MQARDLHSTKIIFKPMQQKDFLEIIPAQFTGTEIEAASSVELENVAAATRFFEIAKKRLIDVNHWHELAGIVTAKFQAVDKDGHEVSRPVKKGDYMRIDIPGPGSSAGDGYDWVMVEELKETGDADMQSIGFRVRPVSNPRNDSKSIAHFYDDAATSNFIVTREANKIRANIVDRNLKPNDETATVMDKIRDTAVGLSAIASFSKIQWKSLADGLVKLDV
jgi:hypothetical protein